MKKENIILVEPISSGVNYIYDVRRAGHNPICLELYQEEERRKELRPIRDMSYRLNDEELPQIIEADESYEKTLEMVRKTNPLAIIPASDAGVIWATRLARDLGLPGNDPKNLKKMMDKHYMQEALKQANLRYIKSRIINSYEEAKEFVCELDNPHVVVKPSVGQGTIGVCICNNDDELKDALSYNKDISFDIDREDEAKIAIQEYIGGEEYTMDTLCCQGEYRVIAASHYKKILSEGKWPIYDYMEFIDESEPHFKEIAEYNFKVLSALGLEYGATHAEYKIDENGPVLIEMNCRISGPFQKISIMEMVWPEPSTRLSLESYINPEESLKKVGKPIGYLTNYTIKIIIIYENMEIIKTTYEEAFKDLESVVFANPISSSKTTYTKTVDLATSGGYVYLANNDKSKLKEDLDTIRRMEKYEVDKLFELKK